MTTREVDRLTKNPENRWYQWWDQDQDQGTRSQDQDRDQDSTLNEDTPLYRPITKIKLKPIMFLQSHFVHYSGCIIFE